MEGEGATAVRASSAGNPVILITNDGGIDAPGLRALVTVHVATSWCTVRVCAPDSDKSAVSHSITWRHSVSVKRVEIDGATAFVVSGLKSIKRNYVVMVPLLPTSQSVYSGTVAGAREAFFNGIPSVSISYDCVRGKSNIEEYIIGAEACLPIITVIVTEIRRQAYPSGYFLNIDLPTDISNHKGKSTFLMGWRAVSPEKRGGRMLSTMTMETDTGESTEVETFPISQEHVLYQRELKRHLTSKDDMDQRSLEEGYISVTPPGPQMVPDFNPS